MSKTEVCSTQNKWTFMFSTVSQPEYIKYTYDFKIKSNNQNTNKPEKTTLSTVPNQNHRMKVSYLLNPP